jgi:DNA end-binding protein Ku
VSFNQINSKTGNRVRMKRIDEGTQEDVDYADIVKGYPVAKNEYITLGKDELEAAAIESTRTIDIDTFVPAEEIDPLYLADPSPRYSNAAGGRGVLLSCLNQRYFFR